jgi:predicted CxxxxCH...CXXCH cytochrome family protein
MQWSTLANKSGALSPAYNSSATYQCANVYCHGVGMASYDYVAVANTDRAPTWANVNYLGSATSYNTNCEKCHGFPPLSAGSYSSGSHSASMRGDGSQCGTCHEEINPTGDASETGWTANGSAFVTSKRSWHMNGLVNAGGGGGCGGCHGYPPNKNDGKTSTSGGLGALQDGGKGAHNTVLNSHVKEALLNASTDTYGSGPGWGQCSKCHPQQSGHMSRGTLSLGINSPYSFKFGGTPVYNGVKGDTTTPKTCFNVLCHFTKTPRWSSGTDE